MQETCAGITSARVEEKTGGEEKEAAKAKAVEGGAYTEAGAAVAAATVPKHMTAGTKLDTRQERVMRQSLR